ncbi:MAG: DMT family transporter [Hyphomicrobiaceae bacterium]|nr:DMT family transporter [Hyphomicrobiaceae bacterium]
MDEPSGSQDQPREPGRIAKSVQTLRDRLAAKLTPLQAAWLTLPGNLRGGIWMLVATLFFSFMVAFIKLAGLRLHVTQILCLRQVVMLILASPAIFRSFPGALRTNRLDLQLIRVVFAFFAMLMGFTAVVHLPLAEATTIQFAKTFFITLLAIFLLGEVVGIRRWGAIIVGFIGVLIVAWPTSGHAFNIYGALAVLSSGCVAAVMILVRKLSKVDPPITILCYQAIGVGLLMLPPTIYFWQTPTIAEVGLIIGIGVLSVIGQTFNIFALRAGEASAVAPLDYSRLIYAVALGYLMFEEWPEPRVFIGALIIIAAAVYTLHRERVRASDSNQPSTKAGPKDM